MKLNIWKLLRMSCVALFCAFVGLSAEANRVVEESCQQPIQTVTFQSDDGSPDMHLAIENNSRFVAPPLVARITGAAVRILTARTSLMNDQLAPEHRANVVFSNHNIRAVNEARLLRLSPSGFRTRYVYSLRRIVI